MLHTDINEKVTSMNSEAREPNVYAYMKCRSPLQGVS